MDSQQIKSRHTRIIERILPHMQTTGELIRLMNYVDDISATLRRIHSSIPTLTPDDRKRLAEYFRKSDPNVVGVLASLDAE
jgi:hypothetical protein